MNSELILLIKLLLAHLVADFLFQNKLMVQRKSFSSAPLYYHGVIVFFVSWLFSFELIISIVIAAVHIVIDGIKSLLDKKSKYSRYILFIGDQLAHIVVILITWFIGISNLGTLDVIHKFGQISNSQNLLILLAGYLIVTLPAGYLIDLYIKAKGFVKDDKNEKSNRGLTIGILERLIVMTLVVLDQYEAIGFLIAAKSLLRFADKEPEVKSELVLIGTLLSFAIAMLVGLAVDWMLVG